MNNKSTKHTKVLILGSGPAGYTAAIYAARAMLKPILVYGAQPGGQLSTTTDVENFPGFSKVIQGPWLMDEMKGQAEAVGTEMIQDHINKVDFSKKPFTATGDSGQIYTADSFIISTGAQARWLNLRSEQEFKGFGVSSCATCDGFFFKAAECMTLFLPQDIKTFESQMNFSVNKFSEIGVNLGGIRFQNDFNLTVWCL